MILWSMAPVWIIDFVGSLGMILVSSMCLGVALKIFRINSENAIANYLLWFCIAIFAFSVSRSLGHIMKHVFYLAGYSNSWKTLSPISGSINTITFIIIATVTLYFRHTETIMNRMNRDRNKIAAFSREVLELNRDIEIIVAERTRMEMALCVSHEVRNPAMVIGGMAKRIYKMQPEGSKEEACTKIILDATAKLEALVKNFAEPQPLSKKSFTSVDLNEIVAGALKIIHEALPKKGVVLRPEYYPEPLVFLGSKHLMGIVLIHVLRNALGACKEGDCIEIITQPAENAVHVLIRDNGPGIPPEIVAHIFDPMYKTSKGPTGIGLPYVKQVVEEQRGMISLTSKLGEGTSVSIRLPLLLGELPL